MKRGYYRSNSRQKSYQRHKSRRSPSRSRDKYIKKQSNYRGTSLAKIESDIKNHFRFKLPNLNTKQEEDTIPLLKSKLNQHIGPVEHITRSRQINSFNLGFKYDIDALSFLQTSGLTVKTANHKIHLDPVPTRAFENLINQKEQFVVQKRDKRDKSSQKRTNSRHKKSKSKSKSRSYSSSSSSRKKHYRSKSKQRQSSLYIHSALKIQIYGVPAYLNQQKVISLLNHFQGGTYKVLRHDWKIIKDTGCEYLQIRMDAQKGERLLENANKLQIDGRPVIMIQETQRPSKQFINYQVQLNFPKAVQPGKVLKYLYPYAKIVQIVANQQIQQDGKSKSFIITFNEKGIASALKKIGELSSGIRVVEPKHGILVYRPSQLLPTRQQL